MNRQTRHWKTPLTLVVAFIALTGLGMGCPPGVSDNATLELQEAGFLLMHIQPVCKLESVLDGLEDGRARMKSGSLAWGDVVSYVIARLSGGAIHATDAGHAQATAYFDYEKATWDERLLELQELDAEFFPTILDSQGDFGTTSADAFGAQVPILGVLGEGGIGIVYKAEQPSPRRLVAIKIIHAHMASPIMRRRFEFEADVLARLDHPGIARIYEEIGRASCRERV